MSYSLAAAGLAVAGVVVLAVAATVRWPRLVVWGLGALGSAYAVWLTRHHDPQANVTAPLFAGALLGFGEIAFAVARRAGGRFVQIPRLASWLAGALPAGVAVSSIVLLAATIRAGRSVLLTLAGTAAVVATVVLLRVVLRR